MKLIIIFLFISSLSFGQSDSLEYYTFENSEDAESYNELVNEVNGYPRQGALRFTEAVFDSTFMEYVISLDKVTYKALKDEGIKIKKKKK